MEEKIFYNSDDFILCGILNKVNENDLIVVLCHGYGGSKSEGGDFVEIANKLRSNNIDSFRFDFRGHNKSSGNDYDVNIEGEIKDLENTLDYLKKQGYSKFILLGSSFGGCIISSINHSKYNIIGLISWYGALDFNRIEGKGFGDEEMKIAKKDGYYSKVHKNGTVTRMGYQLYLDVRKYRPYKNLIKLNIPILFVHGMSDKVIPYEISSDVNKMCKNSKLVLIENGSHLFNDSKESLDKATDETINFINNII